MREKGDWPCYPDYRFNDINYGLWSYGVTTSYDNFVGECPSEQSGCTEYVDHNDNNKRHYFIDNDKLKAAQANCNGQVSQRYGCILWITPNCPIKFGNSCFLFGQQSKEFRLSGARQHREMTPT